MINFFRFSLLLIAFIISHNISAQWIMINQDGGNPDSTAALEIQSTNRGILIPRMTQTERDNITHPKQGLLLYQTDQDTGFYFFRGNSWVNVAQSLDNDADSTNEIQSLSKNGDSLSISGGNTIYLGSSDNSISRDTFFLPNGYVSGSVTLPHSLGRMPTEIHWKNGSSFELIAIYTDQMESITTINEQFFDNQGAGASGATLTFKGIIAVTSTSITLNVEAKCTNITGSPTSCLSSGFATWTDAEVIAILYLK